VSRLTRSFAWLALLEDAHRYRTLQIESLFAVDAARPRRFAAEAAGLYLDYSKQRLDAETLALLTAYAEQQALPRWIERLFSGEAINHTENRAAYHVALRNVGRAPMCIAGDDVMPRVNGVIARMEAFAAEVRGGIWRGASDQPVRDIVNIGIGGSDLGPRMVCEALAPYVDGPRPHFVANVDPAQLDAVLRPLDPATTLFVITSKQFTTQETLANACAARAWLVEALGEAAVARHFVAVSTNRVEVERFGINSSRMFEFWDWVGGRYSLWSAVGLPILLACGAERFQALRAGAHAMDRHFRSAPLAANLPVIAGLLGLWNTQFLRAAGQVVAPYAQRLHRFVGWLQQLEMESNGKGVDRDGVAVDYATTPTLWGDVGTNAQHAFFQMLHQGPAVQPVDFILIAEATRGDDERQRILLANGLAQASALMRGKDAVAVRAELAGQGLSGAALDAAVPHRVFPGNRPSSTLLLPRLDAHHLGALLAFYEHRTFVQSVLWNLNAFDQWGVELGKHIAGEVLAALQGGDDGGLDASTRALIGRLRPSP